MISGSAGDTHCGVGDYTYQLAQHMALDAEVHLYFNRNYGPAQEPYGKLTTLNLHRLDSYSMFGMSRLVGELRQGEYDIVHIQYPSKGYGTSLVPGLLPQRLAGLHSRSRIVVTLHEWSTSHPLRRVVMDQMLPSVDTLVVTNEQEMGALVEKIKGRQVVVIPVGNVLSSPAELASVWDSLAGGQPQPVEPPQGPAGRIPFSLFHYGLPAAGKGLERLLEAMQLVRDCGVPAVLYLGGDYPGGQKRTEDLLEQITMLQLSEAVFRLGHIPQDYLAAKAQEYCLAVFPFDEGYCSKRSSVAALSDLDIPIVVGGGSREEHPYLAPEQNTAAALSVLLIELFKGGLAAQWVEQVERQREYAERFRFSRIALSHLDMYRRLRKVDA